MSSFKNFRHMLCTSRVSDTIFLCIHMMRLTTLVALAEATGHRQTAAHSGTASTSHVASSPISVDLGHDVTCDRRPCGAGTCASASMLFSCEVGVDGPITSHQQSRHDRHVCWAAGGWPLMRLPRRARYGFRGPQPATAYAERSPMILLLGKY